MRPKDLTLRRGLLATFWLMGWKSLHPPRGMDARLRAVPPLAPAYAPRMRAPPGAGEEGGGDSCRGGLYGPGGVAQPTLPWRPCA